jgi:hypothetical protein
MNCNRSCFHGNHQKPRLKCGFPRFIMRARKPKRRNSLPLNMWKSKRICAIRTAVPTKYGMDVGSRLPLDYRDSAVHVWQSLTDAVRATICDPTSSGRFRFVLLLFRRIPGLRPRHAGVKGIWG